MLRTHLGAPRVEGAKQWLRLLAGEKAPPVHYGADQAGKAPSLPNVHQGAFRRNMRAFLADGTFDE